MAKKIKTAEIGLNEKRTFLEINLTMPMPTMKIDESIKF